MSLLKKVALLVRTSNDWSRKVLLGVAQYATEQGGWEFTQPASEKSGHVRLPEDWRGDGIICRLTNAELEAAIVDSKVPAVNVSWLGKHSEEIVKVVSNEEECGSTVAKYFLERHFQNVAYVGFHPSMNYPDTIQESAKATLAEEGVELHTFSGKFQELETSTANDEDTIAAWLATLPKPLGVIAWDSNAGRDMISGCRKYDMEIPEDISIVCVEHDDLVSSLSPVPLSNLDQDPWQVGYLAAKKLDQMMCGDCLDRSPVLISPLSVTQRQSSESSAVPDKIVRESYRFIHETVTKGFNVDDIVRELDIPRRTLEQKYQEFLGMTPAQVIRRARTRVAKRLLRETSMSIQRIAERSGFTSSDALFRTFKRETGVTPTQFRRAEV